MKTRDCPNCGRYTYNGQSCTECGFVPEICPKCGFKAYNKNKNCYYCSLKPGNTKECPDCHKLILKENKTCHNCGSDFKYKTCPLCGVENKNITSSCSECNFDFVLKTTTNLLKAEIENDHDLFISKLINEEQYEKQIMKIVQKHLGGFKSSYTGTRKYLLSFIKKLENDKLLNESHYQNISEYILAQFDSVKTETGKAKELEEEKKPKPAPKSNQLNVPADNSPPKPVQIIQEQSGIRSEFGIHGSAVIKDSPDAGLDKTPITQPDKSNLTGVKGWGMTRLVIGSLILFFGILAFLFSMSNLTPNAPIEYIVGKFIPSGATITLGIVIIAWRKKK